jgi:exopolysaccharide biosynthesis polyprenyl glycosylphosphotransferase
VLLIAGDLLLVSSSLLGAYYARFYLEVLTSAIPPPHLLQIPDLEPYIQVAVLTGGVWVFLLWKEGGYEKDPHFSKSLGHQVRIVLTTGFLSWGFLMAVSFILRHFLLSRVAFAMAIICSCAALAALRAVLFLVYRYLSAAGLVSTRILLLGSDQGSKVLLEKLRGLHGGAQIIGWVGEGGAREDGGRLPEGIPHLGGVQELRKIHDRIPFHQLVVTGQGLAGEDNEAWMEAINFCEQMAVPVYMVPEFLDVAVRRREIGSLGGVPFIRLQDASVHPIYAVVKRVVDVIVSLLALVLGSPFWLLIALLIKLTSRGPVLFLQERAGLHGRTFHIYKFRSMVQGADRMLPDLVNLNDLREPVFNIRSDPRVTPFGRFLRRLSLDEVPQFLNVLQGTMSVVGPRPDLIEMTGKYNAYQRRRLKAKPGITGYQQVMSRGDPSLARRMEYDLFYLKHQSLILDLYIMARTVLVIIRGDGLK